MNLNYGLLIAAAAGDYNKVQNLVKESADVKDKDEDEDGNTPLHNAIRSDHYKLAVIEYLIKKGADSNARDNNKNTPLQLAARFSTLEVVKYLIGQGADIMAKGSVNHTPLHFAVLNSESEIVQYLLEKGADANVVENKGLTSLHPAVDSSSKVAPIITFI